VGRARSQQHKLLRLRDSSTQRPQSTLLSRGRLTERLRAPSWWRRARISAARWRHVLRKARPAKTKARMRFTKANDRCPASTRPQRFCAGRGFRDPQVTARDEAHWAPLEARRAPWSVARRRCGARSSNQVHSLRILCRNPTPSCVSSTLRIILCSLSAGVRPTLTSDTCP
jgi:hypothetical protein